MIELGNKEHLLLSQKIDNLTKVFDAILSLHVAEHLVAARLHGNVQEGVHTRVRQYSRNRLQVFQDVRWVGHAYEKIELAKNNNKTNKEHT